MMTAADPLRVSGIRCLVVYLDSCDGLCSIFLAAAAHLEPLLSDERRLV
jgi:hypothetical protein